MIQCEISQGETPTHFPLKTLVKKCPEGRIL